MKKTNKLIKNTVIFAIGNFGAKIHRKHLENGISDHGKIINDGVTCQHFNLYTHA